MSIIVSNYEKNIRARSFFRYLVGLYPRYRKHLKCSKSIRIARRNGAIIGENVSMPLSLAKRANSNLVVGNNTSIQTDMIDLRSKVIIGNNVIIGSQVEIITASHNVDSVDWEHKYYGVEIEDFCWLATRALILPSCRKIGYGSVCAAGSVVVKNVEDMSIISGNPAKSIRRREVVHTDLCVESLLGNDYKAYFNAYNNK
jgi:acetyltransferase-like isoleucine patch superfamily enzyme